MSSNTTTKISVYVPFGRLGKIMDWCREHCSGDWHITNYQPDFFTDTNTYSDVYEFSFDDERDVTAFSLHWK